MTNKFTYKSPIGNLVITTENDCVTEIKISDEVIENARTDRLSKDITTQLDEYFHGKRKVFNVKLNPKGTEFQKKVWGELLKIPYGKTKSYQEIAQAINNPNGQRAVGSACNKNRIPIIVPCHRVISKSGALTGFAYGLKIKEQLLNIEK